MFDPDWDDGCPSCTAGADEIVRRACSSTCTPATPRSPTCPARRSRRSRTTRRSKGWTFPWYSSFGSDFNYDFHVTLDEAVAPVEYNYRSAEEHAANGFAFFTDWASSRSRCPGSSCFLRVGDDVFHTYSTYARGAERTGGSYDFLDLTALGRQEDWEEPKGRCAAAHAAQPDFAV